MYAWSAVSCHLYFGQNRRGLSHVPMVTRGWNEHRIRVSTESQLWRRKCSCCSCRVSNPRPSGQEPGAVPLSTSRSPTACKLCGVRQPQTGAMQLTRQQLTTPTAPTQLSSLAEVPKTKTKIHQLFATLSENTKRVRLLKVSSQAID